MAAHAHAIAPLSSPQSLPEGSIVIYLDQRRGRGGGAYLMTDREEVGGLIRQAVAIAIEPMMHKVDKIGNELDSLKRDIERKEENYRREVARKEEILREDIIRAKRIADEDKDLLLRQIAANGQLGVDAVATKALDKFFGEIGIEPGKKDELTEALRSLRHFRSLSTKSLAHVFTAILTAATTGAISWFAIKFSK